MMDKDGYPEEEDLQRILHWVDGDHDALLAFVKTLWWPDNDYGWSREGDTYRLSTWGWSGNEDIIAALRENEMFWSDCWFESRRGGHYTFRVR